MRGNLASIFRRIEAESKNPLTRGLARFSYTGFLIMAVIGLVAAITRSETLIYFFLLSMLFFIAMYLLLTFRINAETSKKKALPYALSSIGKTMLYLLLPLLILSIVMVLLFGNRG